VDNRRLDLGVVESLQAEAFGEPGQRTFRVYAKTAEGAVSLWLEKEQVVMLGSAVEELMQRVPSDLGGSPDSDILKSFVGELEVKVGSLAIGYDADHSGFSLEATDFTSDFDLNNISLLATREQFTGLREQIDEIVSAGRPRCPLCGRPLSADGHFCPESNGHAAIESVN
jgi:uncharacterized repeat protein (TIGR03847 family)